MALPLADDLKPAAVIYDCMDELSAFLNAPPELLEREAALLQRADLVFTGGPSLYRAKKDRHPRVYCFPSSVDAKHFATAANGMKEADDQAEVEPVAAASGAEGGQVRAGCVRLPAVHRFSRSCPPPAPAPGEATAGRLQPQPALAAARVHAAHDGA
jgi:hypothetical protein